MNLKRIFSGDDYKGTKGYLDSQKKYEIIRTVIYFGISISLYIAGYITTKTNVNMLTIVAVLGCLPACKSMVGMIMFLKFKSLDKESLEAIEAHSDGLDTLYDLVFTTYDKNYVVGHLAIRGNTTICYSNHPKMDEAACIKHLTDSLALDGVTGVTFKVFDDINKYTQRLEQLKNLEVNENLSNKVLATLLSISL